MDFFARQDSARRHTGLLLVYFGVAVILTILLVYFLPVFAWYLHKVKQGIPDEPPPVLWYPELFGLVCGATLTVVLGGALFKIGQLRRGGGSSIAEMLGGRPVRPETTDFFERRLRNVVEEMAIAAGVPVPPVYVLEHETSINAFAAGFTPSDSIVAVTYGTMTGLTRDELQGVIAHEFSHILNSDMRINLNLMGFLHGLLVIGLTGRILLEFSGRMSLGRRSSRDSGQITIPIVAAGFTLLIVGFTGFFFCKLIKATISRHRERLADASAVQFTRNPTGLADALKKIGGLTSGSRIASPQAEQASHMFFGNALRRGMFNTHPPLKQRVHWLDPAFDGRFKPVSLDELQQQLVQAEDAPRPEAAPAPDRDIYGSAVVAAAVPTVATPAPPSAPSHPDALIDSIGSPMEHHAETARQLIDSIPDRVKSFARDPYGARMLIYFMLLDARAEIRDKQMILVKERAEPEVSRILEQALPNMAAIRPEMRLPIIDLSIPALRFLSPAQYTAFRSLVQALIDADEQVDIFEYALQRVLMHHLDPAHRTGVRSGTANYYALRGLEHECSVVLSVLARFGHEDPLEQQAAFRDAADRLAAQKVTLEFLQKAECSWEHLDAALDKIHEGSFKLKKWVLGGALACLMHDKEIRVEEVELFRAIADTLGCPVPPWVAPANLT